MIMTIRGHAQRIVDGLSADLRAELAAAPLDALEKVGLQVAAIHAGAQHRDRWCDGLSATEAGIVLYLATPTSRRENFTVLHEYAHTLVESDDDAMIWLADQPDDRAATEQLCNEVAAFLLIPSSTIDRIIDESPVTAQHLQQLHRQTEASQTAIAVALARRLTTDGAVILVDRSTNTVAHAALVGELAVWPWQQQTVPDAHPLRRIKPGEHLRTRSWWATPWGERQTYYLDATATDKRAYAVLASTDIWHLDVFHGGDQAPERERRPTSARRCMCGYNGPMTGWPCPSCHSNFCPKCQRCLCDARNAADRSCRDCGLTYAPTALVDGLCSECR